ncbi:hypothetical protein C0J52_15624 [Blattella germanica]|nr:hypothetical protein C0J52_15624 [Blattella germanica]
MVNENSLKQLRTFRSVRISLVQRDLRKTVLSILKTCDLPTTYVDNIEPPPEKPRYTRLDLKEVKFDENDPIYHSVVLKQKVDKQKESEKLTVWLEKNVAEALGKLAAHQPVREEIVRLQKSLCDTLGLQSVEWDCGWNVSHFRGCLTSFQALARHHPNLMHSLQGRKLIFANDTGVNLDGNIMLNSGELLKNVRKQDAALFRIPAFEKAVSRVLRDIKIVRRKFQPKVMAKHYENQLRRLTTSLSDHQGRMGYPKDWPTSLSEYELVVETEAGPLMLSPTGQFIVPSSCPAFLLLAALQKDDNITPDLMIECCDRLLKHKAQLFPSLKGVHLWVTTYYSILSDGEVCVPWNWKL